MTDTGRILLLYLALVNLSAFFIYRRDKVQARRMGPRIPENTLLGLALSGGALGCFLAMRILHHKTRHRRFQILVPVSGLLWLIIILKVI